MFCSGLRLVLRLILIWLLVGLSTLRLLLVALVFWFALVRRRFRVFW